MNGWESRLERVLCPTDLSPWSQAALTFAAGIAARLSAKLTACHCASSVWFTPGQRMPDERRAEIESLLREAVLTSCAECGQPDWEPVIIEGSFDPAADILSLAREKRADLVVMKARKSVFSAFHYGSIVERVTTGARSPVLLLPSRFLDSMDPSVPAEFRQVLFDYDFSEANDKLFPVAMSLTAGYRANLHLLSVLEPPDQSSVETAQIGASKDLLRAATRQRLDRLIASDQRNMIRMAPRTVEWGRHADTVLSYASRQDIDLICTTLSPPFYYFEKLYCAYLGKLLQSAACPILLLRSV